MVWWPRSHQGYSVALFDRNKQCITTSNYFMLCLIACQESKWAETQHFQQDYTYVQSGRTCSLVENGSEISDQPAYPHSLIREHYLPEGALGTRKYSRLVISKSKGLYGIFRDNCTSTYQICRIEEKINRTTRFHKWICNLTPEVRDKMKILWTEQFLLCSAIFCYLLLDFRV